MLHSIGYKYRYMSICLHVYMSISLYIYIIALDVLCVGKEYMPNPSPETEGTTFVCVYTGKVQSTQYLIQAHAPHAFCGTGDL